MGIYPIMSADYNDAGDALCNSDATQEHDLR